MCTVSMVAGGWRDQFPQRWPAVLPAEPAIRREEFEALRREVQSLKTLLQAAKRFDTETGQPDCEQDEKVAFIRKIAEMVGVDMADVFPEAK